MMPPSFSHYVQKTEEEVRQLANTVDMASLDMDCGDDGVKVMWEERTSDVASEVGISKGMCKRRTAG